MFNLQDGSHSSSLDPTRTRAASWLRVGVMALAAGIVTSAGCAPRAEVEAAVPAGTTMVAALEDPISTGAVSPGDRFEFKTTDPIYLEGDLTLPAGTTIVGQIVEAKGGEEAAGQPELVIQFTHLAISGEEYLIDAEPVEIRGEVSAEPMTPPADTVMPDTLAPTEPVSGVLTTGSVVAANNGDIVLPIGQRVEIRLFGEVRVKVPTTPGPEIGEEGYREGGERGY